MHDYLNNRLEELGITKETCPKFLHPDLFSWKALPPGVMIFFAKTLMFYASTPEQVDAVLRSALLTYPSNINYVKPKHAVYIGFFMYGVSCPLEQSWQSPDGFLQLIKDNKQLVFLENEYFMCAAQCGEPPTFLYQRFYFALGKWLFRNFDATATGHLIEIKDGLVFLSKMPRVAV